MAAALLANHRVTSAQESAGPPSFRPPAVPLVTHDPYLSVWSCYDKLTDGWTTHWTGKTQALVGLVRIDGHPYRFSGLMPGDVPPMEQTKLTVWPTRTVYEFRAGGVGLVVTFLSPLLPGDPDLLSRPITYLELAAHAIDGQEHEVQIYVDCSAEWAVNTPDQPVRWTRTRAGDLHLLSFGTAEQPVLQRVGDDVRIDWGYFYLALPAEPRSSCVVASHAVRGQFAETGKLPDSDDSRQPRPANDDWPVLACTVDLGRVSKEPAAATIYLGYDDLYSLEYLGKRVRPYWRRSGAEFTDILAAAARDRDKITRRCRTFDDELMADLRAAGGEKYARLAALAYRQTMAAHKLVADTDGTLLMFPKENFSNGCIGTVDVIFPSSPFFLFFNPRLLEAQLRPVMDYAASPRWKFPFAPHDLGTYPHANGQVYGGGEKTEENQMAVEESANLLILLDALREIDGKPEFAPRYWPVLGRWAEYLRDNGLDPAEQLCTDDFAGHLAHNTNLSLKAILALGAYARLGAASGHADDAVKYRRLAGDFVAKWMSTADDGDHYRLAFDRPGTWSQKYNLFWDRVLGSPLFPPEVARREVAFYKTKLNKFGVPLDNRKDYTKLDWSVWIATLADQRPDFDALITPLYAFANETPDRVPLTDWYQTTDAHCVGFRARSVVGGVYAPMLLDRARWAKWAHKPAKPD